MALRLFFHGIVLTCTVYAACASDLVQDLQESALADKESAAAHWGPDSERYSSCTGHSNRLIPVYTYGTAGQGDGVDLESYIGENSAYRDERKVTRLYGGRAEATVSQDANYMDQTNIHDLQLAAAQGRQEAHFPDCF